jgi:dsDNA-specific endonuclease/ATPase MutS2
MIWWRRSQPGSNPQDSTPGKPDESPLECGQPFVLEITDVLDLHTFAPRDIGNVVEAYLDEARGRGFAQVRIIHGKGIGVQRERVRAILRRNPFVVHYEEAPAEAGSWGATVAWLRPPGCDDDKR